MGAEYGTHRIDARAARACGMARKHRTAAPSARRRGVNAESARRASTVTTITRLADSREPLNNARIATYIPAMRVLCVGRHPYLTEHLCRFFERLGLETIPSVGLSDATDRLRADALDAVICDYDLLATMPLERWERDPALPDVPLIAVSLTRHPGEAHLLDVNGIAGFLYLPTLEPEHAKRLFAALCSKRDSINPPPVLPWPGTTATAQIS